MKAGATAGSEDAIIQRFFRRLTRNSPGAEGLLDDAGWLRPRQPPRDLVVTTDMLVAGVHFFPDDGPAEIGYKALAVNLSDLAAKAAEPRSWLLGLALPGAPDPSWLTGLARGFEQAQSLSGCTLLGGDTVRTDGPLTLSITALGEPLGARMVRRGAGVPGHLLYVTGTIGDAALGLALRREPARREKWRLDEHQAQHLLGRYLMPRPRLAMIPALHRYAAACMDISDGLVLDLKRMCRVSGCGARIDMAALPVSGAARDCCTSDPSQWDTIISGGDDYELLVAVADDDRDGFERAAAEAAIAITRIGELTEAADGLRFVEADGSERAIARSGYQHF